ncbi:MAG: zf-HC2 domain-containing protein [Nitriliruptorales bacterium]|nr:zf-HC2 domain-containing protein [Nitriliruptorales bacterium]
MTMSAPMISCSEAVEQLWEYLEQELDEDRRVKVEQHLAFCRRCCGELEFARELRGFLADARRPSLPSDVERRLTSFLDQLDGVEGIEGTGMPEVESS